MKKLTSILFASIAIAACIGSSEPDTGTEMSEPTEASSETGGTETDDGETEAGCSPLELPPAGDQYGPCLDEDPRCWGHGECTEGPIGVTMCSAEADVCPPVVICGLTLFAKAVAEFGGRCVVHCAADIDCYPYVGFVCGEGFCGWDHS